MKKQKNQAKNARYIWVRFALLVVAVVLLGTSSLRGAGWTVYIAVPLIMLWWILDFICDAYKIFTSIRGFVGRGIWFVVMLAIMLMSLLWTVVLKLQSGVSGWIFYVIVCLVLGFVWTAYSSLASTKISILVNAVLTTLLGLLMQLGNVLIGLIPESQLLSLDIQKMVYELGYSPPQVVGSAVSLVSWPIFFALAIATMVCIFKKYWIEKYNGENDIS